MNKALFPILLIGVIAAIAGALLKKGKKRKPASIKARRPLTVREQTMFFRLLEAFPEYQVLAQVAFSALLETRDKATRNRFDRKVADFVLCSKAFEVIAVIELDDSSHKGRESQDAARERLLTDAGYRVVRYRQVPDVAKLQALLISKRKEDERVTP